MKRSLCSALVVACTLAACGSTTTAPSWFVRTYLGVPSGNTLVTSGVRITGSPVALWAGADQMAVVTWGSSGCPKLPVHMETTGNTLTLTLSSGTSPYGAACTTDAAPTTTIIRVPETVDQSRQVSVTFLDSSTRTTDVVSPRPPSG